MALCNNLKLLVEKAKTVVAIPEMLDEDCFRRQQLRLRLKAVAHAAEVVHAHNVHRFRPHHALRVAGFQRAPREVRGPRIMRPHVIPLVALVVHCTHKMRRRRSNKSHLWHTQPHQFPIL